MNEEILFMGHNIAYWEELQKRAEELQAVDLIQEIADLRGKLSFLKSRVEQMNKVISDL